MNIQQKMAQKAFEKAKAISEKDFDKYLSLARGFPSLIHSCGLMQAVSFAKSKSEKSEHHKNFLKALEEILAVGGFTFENNDLVDWTRKADHAKYLLLSRRALDAAVWLKRYSEALEKEPSKNNCLGSGNMQLPGNST